MSTSVLKDTSTKPSRCRQGSQGVNCKILLFPFARSQLVPSAVSYPHNVKVSYMTQPPPPPAAANAATGPSSDAAGKTAEAELLRLRSACTDLSTQLHALSRTRRQLSAQVSILAVEAVEAGCRGELWITHEGKSNESKFHRVVRSSEITCGREYGEVVREEEMSGGAAGGGGSGAGAGSAKKGTSPTNNTAASAAAGAAAAAAGTTAGSDSPSAEIKHKLCCVPGCTKKEQGKWYGKMW